MNDLPDQLRKCLNRLGFHERTCARCGAEFEAKDEYAYKILSGRPNGHAAYHWFCSWHCLQAWRAEHGERKHKPKKQQTKRAAEIEPLVLSMLQEGFTGAAIARKLDISSGWVSKIKKKSKERNADGNGNGTEDAAVAPDRQPGDQVRDHERDERPAEHPERAGL